MKVATLAKKFVFGQAPAVAGLIVLGCLAAYWQHGYLPNAERPFPLAETAVPLWHLVWLGFWAGYVLALVGEAVGILALPYSMVVLQFSSIHVTPTIQLVTLINPLGALSHILSHGRWNPALTASVCAGGVAGGLSGPFLRVTLFSDVELFRLLVILALGLVGLYMIASAIRPVRVAVQPAAADGGAPDNQIRTKWQSRLSFAVYWREGVWSFYLPALVLLGAGVGLISSVLGVGGGFLLVPLLLLLYHLPFAVLVGATIPYTVVLSLVSLATYLWLLPWLLGMEPVQPEWGWALLIAAGGIAGSWLAIVTQDYVPFRSLKMLLGLVTLAGSLIYIWQGS